MARAHLIASAIILFLLTSRTEAVYKVCAFPSMDSTACKRVEEGNSQVSCVQVTDSVDCSNKLRDGIADFALYNPDDALLAGKKIGDSINVIGEARYRGRYNELNDVELVVVVRKSFSGFFSDLLGKGYCHPGVGLSYKFNDLLLKSFERKVVTKRECTDTYSAAEQEIRDLELFFGSSCRPGAWAVDDNLDNKLKRKYRNMCRLCESPQQCTNGVLNSGLAKGALDCLVVNGGDVAFVSLAAVESYFGLTKGQAVASVADYSFLCPNQTMVPINSGKPCVWASQPWDLFVTRSSVTSDLQTKLNGWLSDTKKDGPDRWQTSLRKLLLNEQRVFVTRAQNNSLPISKYINRGVADDESRPCPRKIEWCTTNDLEKEKCSWLNVATRTFGISPRIECSTTAESKWKCLRKIADRKADLVSIPTDDGFIARKVYNLSTVFFEDNLLGANYKILAVLKSQNSAVTNFKDLKNRRACFPEYNGLAWIAFANTLKQQGLLGRKCLESFFSEACAPGAQSSEFSINGKNAPSVLCNLCSPSDGGSCNPNLSRTERNLRALQCLDSNGDVAFINVQAISTGSSNIRVNASIDQSKYRVLCSNGTIINGILDVDENCALATGVQGEIMARGNRNNVEESDAKELLLQLNKWFGTNDERSRHTISIYDKFRGNGGVLFEDNAISLVDPDDEYYIYVNSYSSLLGNVSQSCNRGTSIGSISGISLVLTAMVILWPKY